MADYSIRNGKKHLYTLAQGECFAIFKNNFNTFYIIVHPERAPRVLHPNGTIEELKCLPDPPSPSAK